MTKQTFGDLVCTGDGSYTILDKSIDEEYHSTYGARSESDELYMINSGFRDEINKDIEQRRNYDVLDVGMGLAYNAMMTLDVWSKAPAAVDIKMCSLEINENLVDALSKCQAPWMKGWPENWCRWVSKLEKKSENIWRALITSNQHGGTFEWEVMIGDASQKIFDNYSFDYIWQDAFSPKKNPVLWSDNWFSKLYEASSDKVVLVTYSVARAVKDGLTGGGWRFEKCKGSGAKRHWMKASK